jgi:hypothetical protein
MLGPWQSERLIYRAPEPEDEAFLSTVSTDPEAFMNAAPFLPVPQSKKSSAQFREFLESCLLGAIVCLPPPTDSVGTNNDTIAKPIPIGVIHLAAIDPRVIHHRRSGIGINIVRRYQGQGFGSEAIKWVLRWGFHYAQLHRIELAAFEWNKGAHKLYERLGFVPEGRKRDFLWFEGRYWDLVMFGMLEWEWKERYGET